MKQIIMLYFVKFFCYFHHYKGLRGTSGVRVVSQKYTFDRVQSYDLPNLEEKLDSFRSHLLSSEDYTQEQIETLKCNFAHSKSQIKQRRLKTHKKEDVFLKINHSWLEETFEIPAISQNRPGRSCKLFNESSERTKRRKTEEIIYYIARILPKKFLEKTATDILNRLLLTSDPLKL